MPCRSYRSKWVRLLAALAVGVFVNHASCATTVTVSRSDGGLRCSGWAVAPDIIATAARCVVIQGHYSVSIDGQTYHVWRSWIHPKYSSEFFYQTVGGDELAYDVAILLIVQREFSPEASEYLEDKDLLPGKSLFAVRAKRADHRNSGEVETLNYTKLETKKNGVVIFNGSQGDSFCFEDLGVPIYARVADKTVVVGIIVDNVPYGKICGGPLDVLDASVILEFSRSIEDLKR